MEFGGEGTGMREKGFTPGERILIVDDNRTVLEMLSTKLREEGMEVETAANGLEALELVRSKTFNLILLDIMMPWLNGFEVARLLKADSRTSSIPIIFLTVRDRIQDKVTGLNLGADDYITKPFDWGELVARIRTVLRRTASLPKASPKVRGIAGGLADISLVNLIQLIEVDKKSGVLTLTRDDEHGYILFNEGQIANAVVGKLRGEAAVYHLLTWTEGGFSFEPYHAPVEPTVLLSNQVLMIEGMRRMDERKRLLSQLPDLMTVLKAREELVQGELDSNLRALLRLFDGRRPLMAVLRDAGQDELETLEGIGILYRSGLLQEIHPKIP